jgi:hypothetical protein
MPVGAWRSRVARLPWEQEVGRSNRLAPTISLLAPAIPPFRAVARSCGPSASEASPPSTAIERVMLR